MAANDNVAFRKGQLVEIFELLKSSLVHKDDKTSLDLAKKIEAKAHSKSKGICDEYVHLVQVDIEKLKTKYTANNTTNGFNQEDDKPTPMDNFHQIINDLSKLIDDTINNNEENVDEDEANGNNKSKSNINEGGKNSYATNDNDLLNFGQHLEKCQALLFPTTIIDNKYNQFLSQQISNNLKNHFSYCYELWQRIHHVSTIQQENYQHFQNELKHLLKKEIRIWLSQLLLTLGEK